MHKRTVMTALSATLLSLSSFTYALPTFTATPLTIPGVTDSAATMVNNNGVIAIASEADQNNPVSAAYNRSTSTLVVYQHMYALAISDTHIYGYATTASPTQIVKCPLAGFANNSMIDATTHASCTISQHASLPSINMDVRAGIARLANPNGAVLGSGSNSVPGIVTSNDSLITLPAPAVTPPANTAAYLTDGAAPNLLLSFNTAQVFQGGVANDFAWYDASGTPTVQNIHTTLATGILAANSSGLVLAHSGVVAGTYQNMRVCNITVANQCDNAPPSPALAGANVFGKGLLTSDDILSLHLRIPQPPTSQVVGLNAALFDATNTADHIFLWELLGESAPALHTDYYIGGVSLSGNFFVANKHVVDPVTLASSTQIYLLEAQATAPSRYDVTLTFVPPGQYRAAGDTFVASAAIEPGTGPYRNRFVIRQTAPVNRVVYNSGWINATQLSINTATLRMTPGTYSVVVTTRDRGNDRKVVVSDKRLIIQ